MLNSGSLNGVNNGGSGNGNRNVGSNNGQNNGIGNSQTSFSQGEDNACENAFRSYTDMPSQPSSSADLSIYY